MFISNVDIKFKYRPLKTLPLVTVQDGILTIQNEEWQKEAQERQKLNYVNISQRPSVNKVKQASDLKNKLISVKKYAISVPFLTGTWGSEVEAQGPSL